MEGQTHRQRHTDRIVDEAAEWFARMRDSEVDAQTRVEFAEWLRASAEHVREYLQLTMLHTDVSELPAKATAEELIQALQADRSENIVSFGHASFEEKWEAIRARRWFGREPIALAASVALLAVASFLTWQYFSPQTHRTAVGEQRSFPLPDGSLVTLNAVSELQVRFTRHARNIRLVSGEALFDVARNPQRPFRVSTQDAVIRAIGTRFNVHRRQRDTTVTVVEGTIEVQSLAAPGTTQTSASGKVKSPPVRLTQGQRAHIDSQSSPVSVTAADLQADLAWRERRLIFDSRPLGAVVDEFNLYNGTRMVVTQQGLREVRVSGAFYANDPRSFALFLESAGLASAQPGGDGNIVLSPLAPGR